jgi:hypothetical protein
MESMGCVQLIYGKMCIDWSLCLLLFYLKTRRDEHPNSKILLNPKSEIEIQNLIGWIPVKILRG